MLLIGVIWMVVMSQKVTGIDLNGRSLKQIVTDHLLQQLEKSLVGYQVNGNPVQREFTLRNIAQYTYSTMSERERAELVTHLITR